MPSASWHRSSSGKRFCRPRPRGGRWLCSKDNDALLSTENAEAESPSPIPRCSFAFVDATLFKAPLDGERISESLSAMDAFMGITCGSAAPRRRGEHVCPEEA